MQNPDKSSYSLLRSPLYKVRYLESNLNYMKIALIWLILLCTSCDYHQPKIIRKVLDNDDIKITWFYYSNITNNTPDMLIVEKGDQVDTIFEGQQVLIDIGINNKNIILKTREPSEGDLYLMKDSSLFGYKILRDTTGTLKDLMKIPGGERE